VVLLPSRSYIRPHHEKDKYLVSVRSEMTALQKKQC